MKAKTYLVTGGTGFIGSALVKRLLKEGNKVRIFDNNSRGNIRRIKDILNDIEFIEGDIRDEESVQKACIGIDSVFHLAYINGTEFFYEKPELVLEVGVKGILNILNGCIKNNIRELILASSSEVYQTPNIIPTDETVPLIVPDILNPRYSYGGGKIISELLAINYGRKYFDRVLIFRPHNVYGPDMGWEHVIPQFTIRMKKLCSGDIKVVSFPIQGTGTETRSFVFIDDFVDGVSIMLQKGEHLGIFHIGTREETTIKELALEIGNFFNNKFVIEPGELLKGGTVRRCPDITKLEKLGYRQNYSLKEGLKLTVPWYVENTDLQKQ